jgi:hypothetical protein
MFEYSKNPNKHRKNIEKFERKWKNKKKTFTLHDEDEEMEEKQNKVDVAKWK